MRTCFLTNDGFNLHGIFFPENASITPMDPSIEKIFKKLNRSSEFNDLIANRLFKNIQITYRLANDIECEKLKIDTAMITFSKRFWGNESAEILIKSSIPEMLKCKSIIMELCNVLFRHEYFELQDLAKSDPDTLTPKRYAYFKEQIEYKAFTKAVEISNSIDSFKFYTQNLYNEEEHKAAENFDNYFRMSQIYGHVEKYENQRLTL